MTWFCAVLIALGTMSAVHAKDQKPNVVMIVTDDQGYGDMSCHGNPYLKTPEMDLLYRHSIRLTDYHVDPTCSPTRGALMTGRYSSRVGVWLTYASRHHLRKDEVCMAQVFKDNGYKTAIFGKWHLGDNYPFRPLDRGFDESLTHGGGVVGETPDYWGNNYYDDVYFRNGTEERVQGYCTDVWFNEAMRFIKENKQRPFFVYVPTNAPHGPSHVPEAYAKPYQGNKEIPAGRALFYGMIASIDENMGRLRKRLQALSLERDTIVVFMNDNGTSGGVTLKKNGKASKYGWEAGGYNAGMRGKKGSAYEGGHRAACFIRWPGGGLDGGRDIHNLTAHLDIMPTLIDLCGLKRQQVIDFDGTSLTPLLKNEVVDFPSRTLFVHHQGRFGDPVGEGLPIKDKDYCVMTEKWRMVGGELYDFRVDPSQRNDVAAKYPAVTQRLKAEYNEWWNDIDDKFDEYCPFVIDPTHQELVAISSQNYLGGHVAYNQHHVRNGMMSEGWAVIDVAKPGLYKITLRRWPRELDVAIDEAAPVHPMHPSTHEVKGRMVNLPSNAVIAVSARLKIGDFDQTAPVSAGQKGVVYEVPLTKGEQKIQTWFVTQSGQKTAAYYVYIEPR